jgi:predicted PurR-regulated permease PerM
MEPGRLPNHVTVTISLRTIGTVFAVVAVTWLALHLATFLLVVFSAIVLATAIDPPTAWLQRHGVPRPLGVFAVFALLGLAVAVLAAVLIPLIGAEATALRDRLPGDAARLQRYARSLAPQGSSSQISTDRLVATVTAHLTSLADRAATLTIAAGHVVVLLFATIVLAYFIAVSPDTGSRLLRRFVPPRYHPHATTIAASIRRRIGGWARGQVVVALTFGVLMGLGLWVLGIPYAASLGAVAAFLEVIPYVGGAVTVVLATLMALTVGWPQVVGVIALYAVLILVETHVLAPLLFGEAVGLPSIAVLAALLAGVELLGIVGALLAIPATVVVWAVVEEYWPTPPPAAPRTTPRVGHRVRRRVRHPSPVSTMTDTASQQ